MGLLLDKLVGKGSVDLRIIVEHLEVGVPEQLRMVLAQALADDLLHVRVVQFALAGRLPGNQLENGVTNDVAGGSGAVIDGKNLRDLSRLDLGNGVVDLRVGAKLRF